LYALLLPPFVWAVQLYLNFGLASHACFPVETPRTSFLPGWERIWVLLLVVNLVCAALCAIGFLTSGYSRRHLRNRKAVADMADGAPTPARPERLRSFAIAGLMVSGVFSTAILFDTIYLWALSTCSQV
jgi:polyferredoxin